MSRKTSFLVLLLGFYLTSSAHAATIIWVSDNKNPAGGATADQGWVDLLRAAGHTVEYRGEGGAGDADFRYWRDLTAAKVAELNEADLIIVSRDTSSGNYDDGDEPSLWNSVTAPILHQAIHIARSSRWLWLNSTSTSSTTGNMAAVLPGHPVFAGVTLDASGEVNVLESGDADVGNVTDAGNGTVIATRADTGAVWIAEWEVGVEYYAGAGQFAGGPRMWFAGGGEPDGFLNFNAEGQKLFLNAVRHMAGGSEPGRASDPNPAHEAADIQYDTDTLSWTAGEFANTHTVYFSTSFDDVNEATVDDPRGALVGQGLTDTTYESGRLEFDQTYYWRVDEVNSAPDLTVFRGATWSFTIEPFSIPITNITATASSSFGESGPEKTIDGSGLMDDLHGVSAGDMWISSSIPATLEYAFDQAYKLHELWVWNSNQIIEAFVGFGAKDVVIEHSLDGENWTVLEGVGPLAQAPGAAGYAHNTTIDFGGVTAQHVRVTVNSVQGIAPQASLSEVQFFFIPTTATRPNPETGASGVAPDVTLSWGRDGREADRHEIYLGSDPDALPLVGSVSESSFDTRALDLQLAQSYHWRVDEVNEAADPSHWPSDVWSFTTTAAIVVDDMESYQDKEFLEIWATWVDGFDDPANGALVGGDSGTPETGIVHDGRQSLPIWFDNSTAPISEATRTFAEAQDWTRSGVSTLVLYFQGDLTDLSGRLYVKINDQKVVYMLAPDAIVPPAWLVWNRWSIDLSALPGLTNVKTLSIGVEGAGVQGVLYVDDIQLVAAVASSSRVVGWFEAESADSLTAPLEIMDESTASGGKYIGTLNGVGNSNNAPPPDGIATYTLTVAGGTYKLTGRIDTEGGNSFWVRILGAQTPPDTELHASGWVRWNDPPPLDGWNWIDIFSDDDDQDATVLFTMDPGTYTLEIARREDGARLDAIALVQMD